MAVTFLQRQPGVIHPLLVEVDVPTIGPGGPHDIRHGLREGAKLLFALTLGRLGLLARGDVASHTDDAEHKAVRVAIRRLGGEERARALRRGHDLLDDLGLPGLDDATVVLHHGACNGRVVVNLSVCLADDLPGRLAHRITCRRVGQQDAAARSFKEDRVGAAFQDRPASPRYERSPPRLCAVSVKS